MATGYDPAKMNEDELRRYAQELQQKAAKADPWTTIGPAFTEQLRSMTAQGHITRFTAATSGPDVVTWLEDFERKATTAGWEAAAKCEKLPGFLFGPTLYWYDENIKTDRAKVNDWNAVKKAMITRFLPSAYEDFLREALDTRKQADHE